MGDTFVVAGEAVSAITSGLGEKTIFDALIEDSKLTEETSKVMVKETATQIPTETKKNNNSVIIIVLGGLLIIFVGAFALIKSKLKSKKGKAIIVDDNKV